MADISKCNGKDCNRKESCLRYTIDGNSIWQSYIEWVETDYEEDCDYFIDNKVALNEDFKQRRDQ